MSSEDNSSHNDISLFDADTQRFYLIQFWIFLILTILSMICSLFTLYHLLHDRTLRQALYNHIIIILLIIDVFYQFIDTSYFIHYFRCFKSFSSSPAFRLIWGFVDWAFYDLQILLYTWATIERHILIFHDQLLVTRKKRFVFHYIPPITITIYCLLYHTIIFFVFQCENIFDNLITPSFYPCAFQTNALFMYETIVNQTLSTFVIVISSVLLLLRVVWQRSHMHQHIHWRHHRKMTIQVLSISFIYLILPFPYTFITLLHLCGMPSYIGAEFLSRAMFAPYYTLFLLPIVSVGSLPELRTKFKNILQFRRKRRVIHPANLIRVRMTNNRIVMK